MRAQRFLAFAALLAALGCSKDAPSAPGGATPAESVVPQELQGKWQLVAMERNGKPMNTAVNYSTRGLKFDGARVLLLNVATGQEDDAKLLVTAHDPAKAPKQFDLTAQPGHPEAGKVTPCVYAVKGDELKLMMGDGERPAALDSSKVTGVELQTYKRIGR